MEANQQADEPSRKVPVLRTENSLIHDEFDSLRGRFDEEMRQMEKEMARFKNQMVTSFGGHHQSEQLASESRTSATRRTARTTTKTTTTTTTTSGRISGGVMENLDSRQLDGVTVPPETTTGPATTTSDIGTAPTRETSNWIENFVNSPLIVDGAGKKLLKLRFDVSAYEPDKILVETLDDRLRVHAKREQIAANKSTFSEYNREFLLPLGVDPEAITSTLSSDGVLTIEAPLPGQP